MQFSAQSLLTNSQPHHNQNHLCFYSAQIHVDPLKPPIFALPISHRHSKTSLPHFSIRRNRALSPYKTLKCPVRVFESGGAVGDEGFGRFNFDAVLSIVEVLCLAPSAVVSIGCAVNWGFLSSQKWFQVNRVFVWQSVLLWVAVVVGALIRRRQWNRVCRDSKKESGMSVVNLVERVEKLEEDLRSSVSIIRVLSRQLEKLGIRFRITRKALKQPIHETAILAQKNSEATRALAIQEDILEKELGEIQKVLLAMQEQQQKQLELIVAIGRAGKLREVIPAGEEMFGQSKSYPENEGPKQKQTTTTQDQTPARNASHQ